MHVCLVPSVRFLILQGCLPKASISINTFIVAWRGDGVNWEIIPGHARKPRTTPAKPSKPSRQSKQGSQDETYGATTIQYNCQKGDPSLRCECAKRSDEQSITVTDFDTLTQKAVRTQRQVMNIKSFPAPPAEATASNQLQTL